MVSVLSEVISAVEFKKNHQGIKKPAKDRLHDFWDIFSKEDNVLIVISADPDSLASAICASGRMPNQ